MDLDLEELAAVIELLDKTDFTDFRYEKGDLRIAVRRGGAPLDAPAPAAAAAAARAAEQVTSAPAAVAPTVPVTRPTAPAAPAAGDGTADDGTVLIRAGMLGVFYRSPKPGDPPFVEVGDKVEADAVVAIVEVMKLMNSLTAGVAGEITAIHAENGQLVEFDQPLFSVRPIP
ncbi:acetyl-CoA carboxylase biotin carboxyl carrier protein [Geodermatophilus sp. SYSU D00965]